MNKFVLTLACALLVGSMASAAATTENKTDETTKEKTNMMGTKTVTHKTKKHMKDQHGQKAEMDVTETTKTDKKGNVEKSVKVEAESTEKH